MSEPPSPDRAPGPVICSHCGVTTDTPGLTWMCEQDRRRGPTWFCDRCSRTHLRSIEAKLDQEYW